MARVRSTGTDGSPFSETMIEAVWQKGAPEAGLSSFRKDKCGTSMQRSKYGKTEQYGWEIDHIKPVSESGGDELSNLQPLQWENNRYKGDNWPDWSCAVKS